MRRAGARLRVPARRRPEDSPCDKRRSRRRARRAATAESAFSTNRRIASCGSSCRAFPSAPRSSPAWTRDCGPPAVVEQRTSLSTRSGAASTSSCAIIPPRLIPSTCARSISSASSTPRASSASCAVVYGPGEISLSPKPRLSRRHDPEAVARAAWAQAPSPCGRSRAPGSSAAASPAPWTSYARVTRPLCSVSVEPGLGRVPPTAPPGRIASSSLRSPAGPSARREPGDAAREEEDDQDEDRRRAGRAAARAASAAPSAGPAPRSSRRPRRAGRRGTCRGSPPRTAPQRDPAPPITTIRSSESVKFGAVTPGFELLKSSM